MAQKLIYGAVISVVFVGFMYLFFELDKVKDINVSLSEKLENADVRTEGIENKIVTLKEEGFVETDTSATLTNDILPSVVFIIDSLVPEGDDDVIGTGFFIDSGGYIATAGHVISEREIETILVRGADQKEYTIKEIFVDDVADVALIKINNTKDYPTVSLGYFKNLEIGSSVGVIGFNPGFTKPLLHTGTISALGRDESGSELFTINAFVNKGNSGSPVFSLITGRVVGILSTRQTDAQGRRLLNPEEYQTGVSLGGAVDPVKFSAQLYNETVKLVEEVSQVGIGVAYSVEVADRLFKEVLK